MEGEGHAAQGGKFREVEPSPRLAEALQAHRHLHGTLAFCADGGSMLTRDNAERIVPAACKRAGLRVLQWHALRHSFASQVTMDGAPLEVVRELQGYATIQRTMRYAHLALSAQREAVATIDRPAGLGTGEVPWVH